MLINVMEMPTLSYDELMEIDGGVNWGAIANAAWIVGGVAMCIPGAGHAVGLICCGFAAGYYLGEGITG